MIALLRYGYGLPHNRLDKLQRNLGIPLPASTRYQIVKGAAEAPLLAFDELVRQAAQGDLFHNDDTTMPVLALTGKRRAKEASDDDPEDRTGMFTTGIASVVGNRKIALYITGRRHAGENLDKVLKQRDASAAAPLQMCDGLARNHPKDKATIVANCMSHGRRHFVDVVDKPSERVRARLRRAPQGLQERQALPQGGDERRGAARLSRRGEQVRDGRPRGLV
jgi:hypothetical protein